MSSTLSQQAPLFTRDDLKTLLGTLGITFSVVLTSAGAAYGTAASSQGIVTGLLINSNASFKMLLTLVMSGMIAIYGVVVSMIYNTITRKTQSFTVEIAIKMLQGGLSCGLSGLMCGYAIGVVGRSYTSNWQHNSNSYFIMFVVSAIFAEVIGIYGLLIAVMIT